MDNAQLIELTADIVSAHVANNTVGLGDVGDLVAQVHLALASIGAPPQEPATEPRAPAVSVRASIKPDYLVCMGCGQQQKTLKRHLSVAHGMTPQQYRSEFGLPASYPMVAPNYSATRREMAHRIGLGTKGAGGRKKAAASTPVPSKARHKTKKS